MSIKTMNMYTLICDRCGTDVMDGTDYAGWGEVSNVMEEADAQDWRDEDGSHCTPDSKHYCRDCWYWADDDDDFHIKPVEAKP